MKNFKNLILVFSVFTMVSCGEDKKQEEDTMRVGEDRTTQETTAPGDSEDSITTRSEQSSDTAGEVVELSIEANDQMQFNKNELRVQAGQTVRLTLTHVGEMAENVMGHNFVLLEKGTDINEFGQTAVAAANNDYIPNNGEQVIAHTELIGGGESVTIEFQAPAAGTYDFICSFPGHYAIMKGKFIVE